MGKYTAKGNKQKKNGSWKSPDLLRFTQKIWRKEDNVKDSPHGNGTSQNDIWYSEMSPTTPWRDRLQYNTTFKLAGRLSLVPKASEYVLFQYSRFALQRANLEWQLERISHPKTYVASIEV